MVKRDNRLYTVTKGNQPAFNKKVNLFWVGGPVDNTYGGTRGIQSFMSQYGQKPTNGNTQDVPEQNGMGDWGQALGMGAMMIPQNEMEVNGKTYRNGAWDLADPMYQLAGDKSNAFGDTAQNVGIMLTKGGLSSGNFGMAIAGAVSKVAGDIINAGWGVAEKKMYTDSIKRGIENKMLAGNALANSKTSNDLIKSSGLMSDSVRNYSPGDLYKGGWFAGGKAKRKGRKLINENALASAYQANGLAMGVNNVNQTQMDNVMANSAAFGGPLDQLIGNENSMGAIGYNFMSDFLTARNRQIQTKDKLSGITAMPSSNTFGDGGNIEIKHPGRLTNLKKRTGKTEAELYNDGNPDHKKMVVFARNARRWHKHAFGGYLEGKTYDVPEDEVQRLIGAGYEIEYL